MCYFLKQIVWKNEKNATLGYCTFSGRTEDRLLIHTLDLHIFDGNLLK